MASLASLEERLAQAEAIIKRPAFMQNKGLGNEVGYYIFDYLPQQEMDMRQWVEYFQSKHEDRPNGFRVLVFDIYDIMIDILAEKGYLEKCYEMEQRRGLDRVIKAVGNTLRITSPDSLIVKYISDRTEPNSVLFLTGIGKCYPIIRAHTLLNNLNQVIDSVPVIMFYPGKYDGQELMLFGEIKDDNYYRAFKLVH